MMKNKIVVHMLATGIAVGVGLLVGAFILLISGYNPMELVSGMLEAMFGSVTNFFNWISYAVPLILTGLAISFAFRSGLFNIGAEGQFIVSSMVAVVLGSILDGPQILVLPFVIVVSVLAGALYATIAGVLKAYFGVTEVVVGIMLNWIAFYYANYFIQTFFHAEGSTTQTPPITESASLSVDALTTLTQGSVFNLGFFIMIFALFAYWFISNRTVVGYEIKAVGYSKAAANYAGVKSNKRVVMAMFISGCFAGLAGTIYALSDPGYMTTASTFRNYGFDGIAVAFLGQLTTSGVAFGGLLFSAMRQAPAHMASVPKQITDIMMGTILISSSISAVWAHRYLRKGDK